MKKLSALVLVGAALVMAAPRTANAGPNDVMAERALSLLEGMATVVDANKTDCPKMGDAMGAYIDAHAAEIAALKAWGTKLSREERHQLETKYKGRFMAAEARMRGPVIACSADPHVRAALGKIGI